MVNAQKAVLDRLGVKHLVAGSPSPTAAEHAFQWGVTYPDSMDGLVPVEASPKTLAARLEWGFLARQLARIRIGTMGWYYDKGGIRPPSPRCALRR